MPVPIVFLVAFSLIGVLVGLAQMNESRACAYCGLEVSSGARRCPHCLCRIR